MNDKIIECKMCNNKMKEYESNNPQPLLPDFNDRVCRECNDYVTASRIVFRDMDSHTLEVLCANVEQVLRLAHSLRNGREQYMKQMEEE